MGEGEGERVVILFEGRDAAGKGGAIKRFTEHLNPRGGRVVALTAPNDAERTQWYFQRYIAHLPTGGEIVLFDRSWYNRAGVERVMDFCTPAAARAVPAAGAGSRGLARGQRVSGSSSSGSPCRRPSSTAASRGGADPLRQWKLTPIDEATIDRFTEYGAARDEMLRLHRHGPAPWTVVNSNVKKLSRLESDAPAVLHELPYPTKDTSIVHAPDPQVVQPASALFAH